MSEPAQDTTASPEAETPLTASGRFQAARWLRLAGKLMLTAALLAGLAWYVDADALWQTLVGANRAVVALAAALVPARIGLEWWIWHRLVARLEPAVAPRATLGSLLCGYTLAVFTPARIGELAARAYFLPLPDRFAVGSLTFLQGMLTQVLALVLGVIAAADFVLRSTPAPMALWILALGYSVGLLALFVPVFVFPKAVHRWLVRWQRLPKLVQRLAFMQHFPVATIMPLVGLSAVRFAVLTAQFVLLARALDPAVGFAPLAVAVVLVYWALYVLPPITLSDLGLREGAAVFFLGVAGVASAAAMGASLLIFGLNVLAPALLGIPFVAQLPSNIKAARNQPAPL
ncbi:MAG: lysylphosphatidylglycerol synthase domain-containing protein [Bacteroidota bacterium]